MRGKKTQITLAANIDFVIALTKPLMSEIDSFTTPVTVLVAHLSSQ